MKFEIANSRGAGFTLLETIVALGVILAAVSGPLALATRGIFSAKFSRSKLIAANLTQEGMEIIRHKRENNILADRDWRTGLTAGSYQPDIFTGEILPLSSGLPLSRGDYFGDGSLLYAQDQPLVQDVPTPFTRVVELRDTGNPETLEVFSAVTWTESGIPRRVELRETLYHWQ